MGKYNVNEMMELLHNNEVGLSHCQISEEEGEDTATEEKLV